MSTSETQYTVADFSAYEESRVVIRCHRYFERDAAAAAIQALLRDKSIFVRDGRIYQINPTDQGFYSVRPLPRACILSPLSRVARWFKRGRNDTWVVWLPPGKVVAAIYQMVRELDMRTGLPALPVHLQEGDNHPPEVIPEDTRNYLAWRKAHDRTGAEYQRERHASDRGGESPNV